MTLAIAAGASLSGSTEAAQEQMAMEAAESALVGAGTSIRNELAKAKDVVTARGETLRNLKVVPMPRSVISEVADHVTAAQLAGQPMLLTRVSSSQARANRRLAIAGYGLAGSGKSWDEYSFASGRLPGSRPPSVMAVSQEQNLIQGGIIAICYKLQAISVNDSFYVVVTP